ncbi:MAG: leucine--tRNA ligase [Parcubacteria group bacterium]|nr:leucine--tRNA ligase [Parcubacteria group bacterium]
MPYDHQSIEKKWQKKWEESPESQGDDSDQDTLYHLVMFPYPSGSGLHVGHVESYSAVDMLTRMERMRGKKVLFPMGYDAFGLPAENYAIKTGVHPAQTTAKAIETFRTQLKSIGLSFDWDREVSTADPDYYRWTQWLFLLFFKNGLAYRAKSPVNWCTSCTTVLANEQVVSGACERCDSEVIQKELEQWFFKITDYAERLLTGMDTIDWPEKIKAMQRNWIGKSVGATVDFSVVDHDATVSVFTTRPDTLFGATYVVLAPEHALVDQLVADESRTDVEAYRVAAGKKSALERTELQKVKTGVFTGAYAINPVNDEKIPIWIADYVMVTYGTGAIMAVPAHDERDFEFAKKYKLPIKKVVEPPVLQEVMNPDVGISNGAQTQVKIITDCFTSDGTAVNSGLLDCLKTNEAKEKINGWLTENGLGGAKTTYRIRDWLVSRQRYWGAPIPIIWCESCGPQPVPENQLPVVLPNDVDFKPTGESPLVGSKTFHDVTCPACSAPARRESDTMDTFVDSSWYYLRYCDPKNDQAFADREKIDNWCPVDLYVGGAEHAVMHLLYARFFSYALHDLGYVGYEEPFVKLRNQGLILGPDGDKMSKSKGNVVNPDEIVSQYGADSIRLYEMFLGPLEDEKPWDTKGVVGVRRFLEKVWKLQDIIVLEPVEGLETQLHKTIKKVTGDYEELRFNTAIAKLMELTNAATSAGKIGRDQYAVLVQLLAPLAPHLSEELWELLGHKESIFTSTWPTFDPKKIVDTQIEMGVQVNGKVRGSVVLAPDASEDEAMAAAHADENVTKYLDGKDVMKIIYVPGRILNIVVK